MGETDRQTDKTTRWAFTAFEPQWSLFESMPDIVKEWGWQTEVCPDTQRKHYQGYILTRTQQRFAALRKALPGVHVEAARNWSALLNYCKKTDTAVEGTQKHEVNVRKYLKFHEALQRIANAWIFTEDGDFDTQYQRAIMALMLINEEDVSLYSNPQLMRAFKMTQPYWLRKSLHSQDVCQLTYCEWCEMYEAISSQEFSVPEIILECCSIEEDGSQQTQASPQADEASSPTQSDAE